MSLHVCVGHGVVLHCRDLCALMLNPPSLPSQVFGAPMGPGGNSAGSHMMPGNSPGMNSPQFMSQQGYPEPNKAYMQSGMYGRPSGAYQGGPGYGGR